MRVIKLVDSDHDKFYDFVVAELTKKKLITTPYWSVINWISDDRDIYAVVDNNDEILMVNASNKSPITNMPWRYWDTQIGKSGRSFYEQKEVTVLLLKTMLSDYEEQGYWGHWFLSDYRKDKAYNRQEVKTDAVKEKLGRFVLPYLESFKNYTLHDVAWIKKGSMTEIPFYDRLLKDPAPYDMVLRFAALDNQLLRDNKVRYTYG